MSPHAAQTDNISIEHRPADEKVDNVRHEYLADHVYGMISGRRRQAHISNTFAFTLTLPIHAK